MQSSRAVILCINNISSHVQLQNTLIWSQKSRSSYLNVLNLIWPSNSNRPDKRWYYCLHTGINQMHYHIQKNEFSTKLSSKYEGYENFKTTNCSRDFATKSAYCFQNTKQQNKLLNITHSYQQGIECLIFVLSCILTLHLTSEKWTSCITREFHSILYITNQSLKASETLTQKLNDETKCVLKKI